MSKKQKNKVAIAQFIIHFIGTPLALAAAALLTILQLMTPWGVLKAIKGKWNGVLFYRKAKVIFSAHLVAIRKNKPVDKPWYEVIFLSDVLKSIKRIAF